MNRRHEEGFSLVEVLIVVVVIGIVAALAVPSLQKGIWAAQNGNTSATLRTIASTQATFYTQRNRFGRLDEVNPLIGNSLGPVNMNQAMRHRYVFAMVPALPTDLELKDGYIITATRSDDAVVYQYRINELGQFEQVLP